MKTRDLGETAQGVYDLGTGYQLRGGGGGGVQNGRGAIKFDFYKNVDTSTINCQKFFIKRTLFTFCALSCHGYQYLRERIALFL